MKRTILVLTIFSMLLCMGCALANNYAQQEWTNSMRQMGVAAVYPPREDIQVGDMYLYDYDPNSKAALKAFKDGDTKIGMAPRWATAYSTTDDVLKRLKADYQNRPTWPTTTNTYKDILVNTDANASMIWSQPSGGSGDDIYKPEDHTNRLRLVAFPDFATATVTQGGLSALIPAEVYSIKLGGALNKLRSVNIKIPAAESYSLPSADLIGMVTQKKSPGKMFLKSNYLATLITDGGQGPENLKKKADTGFVWITIISEVYYARALDLTIQTKNDKGAQASLDKSPPPTGGAATSGTPETPGNLGTSGATASTGGQNVNNRAEQLKQTLAKSTDLSVPGGSLSFVTTADGNVSMRRIWDHPIAVGIRGVTLKVKAKDGEVVNSASPISGTTPPALH